jgi:DNA-binding response OmpR family regulator
MGGREGTLLVVEDDEETLNVLSRALAAGGYEVVWARNGEDTLKLLMKIDSPVALMIVDVMLPGMPATELVAEVGREHPDAGVIYISAYDLDTVKSQGVDPHRMAFLPKPFDTRELLDAVEKQLEEGATEGEGLLDRNH